MWDFIQQPWQWYVAGPLIALTMIILIFWGKSFGISSTLRTTCAMAGAGKFSDFFRYDWKRDSWNLLFILGAVIGGFIANQWLSPQEVQIALSDKTLQDLQQLGIDAGSGYLPEAIFGFENLFSFRGVGVLALGGFLIGFGTRYAGGCTSGHAISGLSNLQIPSFIAVIGFFIGGLVMTHFLLPFLLP